ncbi:hypothetical protein OESDEN_17924 [Oesophagostomum dentatum]|uniref:Uncharacterized protein n=1 Tax=Oesophagostomum dentatum TaxID=61180 RepID=A0A0B1SFQ5_OESDE|nr:hypothetical protein OESDEN_17924 [Oesophagostomum dentatum]
MANRNMLSDSESDPCEEDCFEGMNITVNAFDTCDIHLRRKIHQNSKCCYVDIILMTPMTN